MLRASLRFSPSAGDRSKRALVAAADVDVVSSLEADAAAIAEQLAEADGAAAEFTPELALLDAAEAELADEGRSLSALGRRG